MGYKGLTIVFLSNHLFNVPDCFVFFGNIANERNKTISENWDKSVSATLQLSDDSLTKRNKMRFAKLVWMHLNDFEHGHAAEQNNTTQCRDKMQSLEEIQSRTRRTRHITSDKYVWIRKYNPKQRKSDSQDVTNTVLQIQIQINFFTSYFHVPCRRVTNDKHVLRHWSHSTWNVFVCLFVCVNSKQYFQWNLFENKHSFYMQTRQLTLSDWLMPNIAWRIWWERPLMHIEEDSVHWATSRTFSTIIPIHHVDNCAWFPAMPGPI